MTYENLSSSIKFSAGGFRNAGNTCFFNAAVQGLIWTKWLTTDGMFPN